MNKLKIGAGIAAGLLGATLLVGTAFAAPIVTGRGFPGYGMMRSLDTSATLPRVTWGEMKSFMDRYRTPDGRIDVQRMHKDVASGKVTPPCLAGAARKAGGGASTGRRTTGYGYMMGGAPGAGMMGRSFQ